MQLVLLKPVVAVLVVLGGLYGALGPGGLNPNGGSELPTCSDGWQEALSIQAKGPKELSAPAAVRDYYSARGFCPVWFSSGYYWTRPAAFALVDSLQAAPSHGLNPRTYHLDALRDCLNSVSRARDLSEAARCDVLFSDSFFAYGTHLREGRFVEAASDMVTREPLDPPVRKVLSEALNQGKVTEVLERMVPDSEGYRRMRQLLERYRRIAQRGGWHRVEGTFQKGDHGEKVIRLVERLAAEGYLNIGLGTPVVKFDERVVKAVEAFQKAHGLAPDGVVGPATRDALNRPVKDKIREVISNLERMRWLPHYSDERHVVVDVTAFRLELWDEGRVRLEMPVVVGREAWETPVLSDRITYLVLNPTWRVPESISRQEILPKLVEDSSYLTRNRFEVHPIGDGGDETPPPEEIDWENLLDSEEPLPYRLVQKPGPNNPLGSIKFIFPNPEAIYLHGTPGVSAFQREVRTLSHGCIRVRDPLALAVELLSGKDGLESEDRLKILLAEGKTREIPLPEPVPVVVRYVTVWTDGEGHVQFRNDVYGWNDRLYALMGGDTATVAE